MFVNIIAIFVVTDIAMDDSWTRHVQWYLGEILSVIQENVVWSLKMLIKIINNSSSYKRKMSNFVSITVAVESLILLML